jgi:hypothetical protein
MLARPRGIVTHVEWLPLVPLVVALLSVAGWALGQRRERTRLVRAAHGRPGLVVRGTTRDPVVHREDPARHASLRLDTASTPGPVPVWSVLVAPTLLGERTTLGVVSDGWPQDTGEGGQEVPDHGCRLPPGTTVLASSPNHARGVLADPGVRAGLDALLAVVGPSRFRLHLTRQDLRLDLPRRHHPPSHALALLDVAARLAAALDAARDAPARRAPPPDQAPRALGGPSGSPVAIPR